MKQSLASNPLYYDPYIMHDIVTIYDKSTNQYVDRHRTMGVSFSRDKQIIIATTVCSGLDTFNKKKGTNIVRSRINTALKSCFNRKKNVLYFRNISEFNTFCDRFDDMSKLMFVPYEVSHMKENTITRERLVDPKNRNSAVKSPSDIYLNAGYVRDIHTKFFYSEEKEDEQPAKLCRTASDSQDAD